MAVLVQEWVIDSPVCFPRCRDRFVVGGGGLWQLENSLTQILSRLFSCTNGPEISRSALSHDFPARAVLSCPISLKQAILSPSVEHVYHLLIPYICMLRSVQKTSRIMSQLSNNYPWTSTPLITSAPMRMIAGPKLAVEVSKAGTC